jgi:hypothetical protein
MTRRVAVRRTSTGQTTVTVTVREGDHSASWSVKKYSTIREAMAEADSHARKALAEIMEEQ